MCFSFEFFFSHSFFILLSWNCCNELSAKEQQHHIMDCLVGRGRGVLRAICNRFLAGGSFWIFPLRKEWERNSRESRAKRGEIARLYKYCKKIKHNILWNLFFYYFVLSALRESSFCLNCKAEEYEGESSDNSQGRHDLPLVKLSFIGINFSPSGNTSEILNHVVQSEQKLDQHPNGEAATIIPRWIELVRSSTNIDRLVTREQKVHQKYASSETKTDGCISLVNRLVSRWLETWSSLK